MVEKESGKKVKALRSDNGGEYVSNEFNNLCVVEGFKRELTTLHNPQQNGVAERKNKIIVGATQMMLHFQNHSPHQILGMKTLEEDSSNKRTDVGNFRIFGSSVYFYVTKYAWKNLELTTMLRIFVGYIDTPHNYQMYLSASRMTVVRRDVRFYWEKSMRVSLERELDLHVIEDILGPKFEEPQMDLEQPHAEDPGVETST